MDVPLQVTDAMLRRDRSPVAPRPAATVALLRAGVRGRQTYLLHRASSMAFAPGQAVFPGGGVDERDREPIRSAGPAWSDWAQRLGCDEPTARATVVAGVRETFEESGILLAGRDGSHVLDDTSGDRFALARSDLEARRISLAELVDQLGLVVRTDLIVPWARWITPTTEAKRYDTMIFVADLPSGQQIGTLPSEAQSSGWIELAAAVRRVGSGQIAMLPPTFVTCRELADPAVDPRALSADRDLAPIEPRLVQSQGKWFLRNSSDEVRHVRSSSTSQEVR